MKKPLIFLSAILALLTACSTEAPQMLTTDQPETPGKFDLNAALAIAEQAMNDLDPTTRGKSILI